MRAVLATKVITQGTTPGSVARPAHGQTSTKSSEARRADTAALHGPDLTAHVLRTEAGETVSVLSHPEMQHDAERSKVGAVRLPGFPKTDDLNASLSPSNVRSCEAIQSAVSPSGLASTTT